MSEICIIRPLFLVPIATNNNILKIAINRFVSYKNRIKQKDLVLNTFFPKWDTLYFSIWMPSETDVHHRLL